LLYAESQRFTLLYRAMKKVQLLRGATLPKRYELFRALGSKDCDMLASEIAGRSWLDCKKPIRVVTLLKLHHLLMMMMTMTMTVNLESYPHCTFAWHDWVIPTRGSKVRVT